jgi:hypothetical protein
MRRIVVYAHVAPRTPRRPIVTAKRRSRAVGEVGVLPSSAEAEDGAADDGEEEGKRADGWAIRMTPTKETSPANICFRSNGASRKKEQAQAVRKGVRKARRMASATER